MFPQPKKKTIILSSSGFPLLFLRHICFSCMAAWRCLDDYFVRCCDNAIAPSCFRRSKRQSLNAEVMRRGQSSIRFRDRLNSLETSGTSLLFRDTRTHELHQSSCSWLPFVLEMPCLSRRFNIPVSWFGKQGERNTVQCILPTVRKDNGFYVGKFEIVMSLSERFTTLEMNIQRLLDSCPCS